MNNLLILLLLFLLCQTVATEIGIHSLSDDVCNSSRKLTLAIVKSDYIIQKKNSSLEKVESLNDLKGFSVEIFKSFFQVCPMKYEILESSESMRDTIKNITKLNVSIVIPHVALKGRTMKYGRVSQYSHIVPSVLAYLQHEDGAEFSMSTFFNIWDGIVIFLVWGFGALILLVVVKIERICIMVSKGVVLIQSN